MLRGREVKDITELRRQGLTISQIGAVTGFDRKTIRKYLNDPTTPHYVARKKRDSKLDAFKPYIEGRLKQGAWNATVLLGEIQKQGYTGGITILRDFLRPLRKEGSVVAVRRFETPPGLQAQLDWGEMGHIETTEGRKTLYAFKRSMFLFSLSVTAAHCSQILPPTLNLRP